MCRVVAEQIERDRAGLPESVVLKLEGVSGGYTSLGLRLPNRGDSGGVDEGEPLKTMTLNALDIELDDLELPATTADQAHQPEDPRARRWRRRLSREARRAGGAARQDALGATHQGPIRSGA